MAASESKKNKNTKKKIKKNSSKGFWRSQELWIPAVALLLLTFVVFFPSLNCDFVNWDDDVNILKNNNILNFDIKGIFTETVIGGYNPLTTFVFAIQHKLFGLNPKIFHLTNILFHLGCTFWVYRLMLLLGLSRNAALLGAALFALHPMRVESVTWITELKDVLFGFFYLAALFFYTKAIKNKRKIPHHIIIPLFVASLFAKIQAVSLPLSMLAIDYYFNRTLNFKLVLNKTIYFLLSLAVGVLGIIMLSGAETLNDDQYFSFLDRILIGIYSLVVYLGKFIFPFEMSPLYPYPYPLPWYVYASPIIFLGLLFLVVRAFAKDQKAVFFAALFFVFNIMFVLQVLGAGQGYLADRFTYIPYIGFFFLLGYGFDWMIKNRPSTKSFLPYIAAGYVAALGFMTFQQIGVWKNSESLWLHVINHYPEIQRPYSNLAHHYRESGRYEESLTRYNQAVERGGNAGTYNGRGKAYFDKAIRTNPQQPPKNLVNNAIADYTKGIAKDPSMPEIHINRGAAYASIGRFQEALSDLNTGLEKAPNNANGYHNRSLIYSLNGDFEKAIADHTAYLKLRPNSPEIYYERGLAKENLKRFQEAVQDYTIAINMSPNEAFYYVGRSRAYKGLQDAQKSNADYQRAKDLGWKK